MTSVVHPIQIIQGGQYGSEAKGAVAAYMVLRDNIDIAVRTGATNAGHTVWHNGKRYVMQQLPTGWVRPETRLVIGAGALVDMDVVHREIHAIREGTGEDIRHRLYVDPRAHLHQSKHAEMSSKSGRHYAIGATGKGCSEALISRLRNRGLEDWSVGRHADRQDFNIVDTEEMLNEAWDAGSKIQLEGTQGQLLDLCLGPYPFTTHKQTGPGQWMLEAGLSPSIPTDIIMVVRTYPIRVAGNSGPLDRETSWLALARSINRIRLRWGMSEIVPEESLLEFERSIIKVVREKRWPMPEWSDGFDLHRWDRDVRSDYREALSNLHSDAIKELSQDAREKLGRLFEMTTVTRKLRRIALLSYKDLRASARQIRPHRVAVTFMNYISPTRWCNAAAPCADEKEYLSRISDACGADVFLINRGPLPEHFVEVHT